VKTIMKSSPDVENIGQESLFLITKVSQLLVLKGTVSRDFLLLIFFMNQFPPSPRVPYLIRTVSNLPPVSRTLAKLVAKFAAGVVDTGGAP
jgi:hypothetical protein